MNLKLSNFLFIPIATATTTPPALSLSLYHSFPHQKKRNPLLTIVEMYSQPSLFIKPVSSSIDSSCPGADSVEGMGGK